MPNTINAKRPTPVGVERVVGLQCPNDGREWHVQCARCGSSLSFEECANCGGEGVTGHDCGEDCCCCLDPEDNVVCDCCGGEGDFPECASQPSGWCLDHPMPGREAVHVGTPEWFTVEANTGSTGQEPA